MKNKILTLLLLLGIVMPVLGYNFHFTLPFRPDDWEEIPSNLVNTVNSSNTNLVPNTKLILSTLNTNPFEKLLSVRTSTNVFGSSVITLTVTDNGVVSEHSDFLEANVGIVSTNTYTNSALKPTVIVGSNSVLLRWNMYTNSLGLNGLASGFPYKILRMPWGQTDQPNTIGWTYNTNYTDNSVEIGKRYQYRISFVPSIYTNYFATTLMSTNIAFTLNVDPPIPLQFTGDGYAFQAYANKNYGIFYKNDINEVFWKRMFGISADADHLFLFRGDQYTDKIIYVREE